MIYNCQRSNCLRRHMGYYHIGRLTGSEHWYIGFQYSIGHPFAHNNFEGIQPNSRREGKLGHTDNLSG